MRRRRARRRPDPGDPLTSLQRPSGVLFDAGGTLVRINVARLSQALRDRGHEPEDLARAFWRAAVLLDEEGNVPRKGEFADWWRGWQGRFAGFARVPASIMHEAYAECDAAEFLWDEPIPGATECIERLREAGIRVGVVSNSDGRAAESLERAGLAHLFEVIVDSTVVGVAKPDPAIFDHALEPMGLDAAQTWYIGDTVYYDAGAADAAGLLSWIIDHEGLHTVDHPRRVRSLAEFADAVLAAN